ncbi:TRAP transporter substrate-binding protein [Salicibibacter cibarius]|uniref:TRAP transporter substrate-binding protein n=1 Tax=Salicibibacter cibarius TaxID=2743000 RepID=A0A7T7CAC3_9BACI|nr:TRAP transporter substrate-binding protein [Salicibibacter cibarius]QQK74703.1 TRAP transporter substrate-binding protein [Salicibibacter cibarius]
MFNKKIKIFFFTSLIILLSACNEEASTTDENKMTITLVGSTPEDHAITLGAEKFKEIIEERSNGQIEVDYYPNLQLGSLREQVEANQMGTIDMSVSLLSTISPFVDEYEVLEYFFLWPEEEELIWEVLDEEPGREILSKLRQEGFEGLGFWAGGYKAVTSNDIPVLNMESFGGMSLRVAPSRTLITTFDQYGAVPTPVDFGELYTALQQGTVDAQENPMDTINTMNLYEVQDHLTLLNHGYQFHVMTANQEWFNSLSLETQELIQDAEKEARLYARDLNEEQTQSYIDQIEEDADIEVHELDEQARKEFTEMTEPLHEELSDTERKMEILNIINEALEEVEN